MKVKICGITRAEDAQKVESLGGWAIGFIFYGQSPRYILPEMAVDIARDIRIKKVGVFVNEEAGTVNDIAEKVGLDFVQLHGKETPDSIAQLVFPVIKAVRLADEMALYKEYKGREIDFFLVDAADTKSWGGTGQKADKGFSTYLRDSGEAFILSGGLRADNVVAAIADFHPAIIDVSSGVEKRAGVKDFAKLENFFEKVKNVS